MAEESIVKRPLQCHHKLKANLTKDFTKDTVLAMRVKRAAVNDYVATSPRASDFDNTTNSEMCL